MTARKPLTVTINWPTMFYACMDCYCSCGEHFHVDVWDQQKRSPEHVRCPECKAVYRVGNETLLVTGKINYDRLNGTTHAFVQWKGTELHGTAHCSCGHDDAINRDFAYDHTCSACKAEYKMDCHVELHRLSDADVAALAEGVIVEPEKEHDDDVDVQPVAAPVPVIRSLDGKVAGHTHRVLIIGDIHTPGNLGALVGRHVFEKPLFTAPPVIVAADPSDGPVNDVLDLFAVSRWPSKPSK